MQDKASGARPPRSNQAQDTKDQGVVLTHVLDLHPVNLILPELVSGLTGDSEDFAEGDRFTRAVRDLAASGLLGFHLRSRRANPGGGPVQPDHGGNRMSCADRFAQNLRRCRRVADLCQEQLGLLAGLHRTEIGLLERGARVPRIDTLLKLAAALDIAASALLDGISWEPGEAHPGHFKLTS